jgi:serine protease inhibitor
MKEMSAHRRLLLKAGLGTLLGLAGQSAFAEILESSKNMGHDGSAASDLLMSAQVRLAENLIRQFAGEKKGSPNIIVSPASLAAILSFVELGGSDPMRSAIHRALGFKPAAKNRANADLRTLRTSVAATIANSAKNGPLALANLLVFDPSTKPRQLALLALSGAGADVLVDRLSETKTIDRINEWVRKRTHDLIPSIIEEAPEDLGLVAINALYFKDRWSIPFNPERTQVEPFQTLAGNADVPMMHSPTRKFAFRQDDRFIAAELAYANEDFKLVVVTTKSAPARMQEFGAVIGWLGGRGFDMKNGDIALPKLSLTAAEELLPPLDALGLRAARQAPDSLRAFSPASLTITRVVQKLELRLNEEGTEAAAATAVTATRSIAQADYVKMNVDKPFVFALRDQRTRLILFMGYVGSPPAAKS